jgi:hypothetical protein
MACIVFAVAVTGAVTVFTDDSSWGAWPWWSITDLAAFEIAYLMFLALLLTWRRHRIAP